MNNEAQEFRARRDTYLTFLLNMLKDRIAKGTDKPCITGNILKDPEAKLNDGEFDHACQSRKRRVKPPGVTVTNNSQQPR